MSRFLLLAALSLPAAACHDARPAAPAPAPAPPAPAPSRLSLFERLAREGATRPAAQLPIESVAAAFAAGGRPLTQLQQVLASPIGARYCMTGRTGLGNVVALCEFGSPDEAERGLTYSRRTFDGVIPNRTLARRGSTVLTVSRPDASAARGDETRALGQIFAAL